MSSVFCEIDRIDVAEIPSGDAKGKYIRIIDYKSSVKDLDVNTRYISCVKEMLVS